MFEELEDDDIDVKLIEDTVFSPEIIRLDVFTRDAQTDNSKIGNRDSAFSRIFLRDSLFNGSSYSSAFLIDMSRFEANAPQQKGVVIIRIKSVDRAFYDYMVQYDKYQHDLGKIPASQLDEPNGNIQNGLGIFGAATKREWRLFYDDL